jgi:hypothetical protein
VCQIQRTNKFHNYQGKETSTHEEREREKERKRGDPCENSHASTTSHIMPLEIGFQNFARRNEEKKRQPKHSKRDGDKNDHTHTKREEKRERDGDNLHDAVAMTSGVHKLPDPQNRIPAK